MKLLTITDEAHAVPRSGSVDSSHAALYELESGGPLPWDEREIERLADSYWPYLIRSFRGLLRVRKGERGSASVWLFGLIPLLRLGPLEVSGASGDSEARWRVLGGALVAKDGRGKGHLIIKAEDAGAATARIRMEVENYYPWIRGGGWFSRIGVRAYAQTQVRFHRRVTHGFLRSIENGAQ